MKPRTQKMISKLSIGVGLLLFVGAYYSQKIGAGLAFLSFAVITLGWYIDRKNYWNEKKWNRTRPENLSLIDIQDDDVR